jgi:hypothetical protein
VAVQPVKQKLHIWVESGLPVTETVFKLPIAKSPLQTCSWMQAVMRCQQQSILGVFKPATEHHHRKQKDALNSIWYAE